jgi:hypothetical protein
VGSQPDSTQDRPLRSWKEIAAFLAVTERSAQRWEKTAGLPVHRMGGGVRARIVAYPEELRNWIGSGAAGVEREVPPAERRARRPRIGVVIAACALVVVLIGWASATAALVRVPAAWSLQGSRLTVVDGRERVCWEKSFPPFNKLLDASRHDIALISDIDGDGRRETLFNFFPQDLGRVRSSLHCYDRKGRLRWEHPYGAAKTFGGRSFEPLFAGHFIRPVSIRGRGYVLVVANHYIWYPAQIALLDAATGRLVEEYWHPGLIEHLVLADLDGDGVDEAVFAGINNPGEGLGHAGLGILKLPFSAAPRRAAAAGDAFPPVTGGGELAYALFPLPDVNRALAKLPASADLKVDERKRILFETTLPEGGGIIYYLSFDLQLIETRFSDNFAPLHDRLYGQGLLDHLLTADERASLGTIARFDAAPDGNSPGLARFWKR